MFVYVYQTDKYIFMHAYILRVLASVTDCRHTSTWRLDWQNWVCDRGGENWPPLFSGLFWQCENTGLFIAERQTRRWPGSKRGC